MIDGDQALRGDRSQNSQKYSSNIMGTDRSHSERLSLLRNYGSWTMAYSTLQSGLQYFDVEDGFIAYKRLDKKHLFVLSDPVCPKAAIPEILKRFVTQYPYSCFLQISESTAKYLISSGFYANVMGTETILSSKDRDILAAVSAGKVYVMPATKVFAEGITAIRNKKDELYAGLSDDADKRKQFWRLKRRIAKLERKQFEQDTYQNAVTVFLQSYLRGAKREFLRRQYSAATREGVTVYEIGAQDWPLEIISDISQEWLHSRRIMSKEMSFLTRPLALESDIYSDVRCFMALQGTRYVGFALLDPMYLSGKITGYYIDIIRTKNDAHDGTVAALTLTSIATVFMEGVETISLGLSPMHAVAPVYLSKNEIVVSRYKMGYPYKRVDNIIATALYRFLFHWANRLYNAQGQAFHKTRFRANMIPTFLCSRQRIPFSEVAGCYKLCGVEIFHLLKNISR